jgi:cyclic beta-1,2-glucan synthetase
VYRIKVENPLGVSRGVVTVEVDGVEQKAEAITLVDDEKTHNVRILMGEPARTEESSGEPARHAQA